jgi:hypothetical protein
MSSFPTETAEKEMVNELFQSFLKATGIHVKKALYLDHREMLTTQYFLRNGYSCNQLFIVEKDEQIHQEQEKKNKRMYGNNLHCFHMKLSTFLNHMDIREMNCIFFDFMGFSTGNQSQNEYPLRDIFDYLFYTYHATKKEHRCIGLTFCTARQPQSLQKGQHITCHIIQNSLVPLFEFFGYCVQKDDYL